MSARVSSWFSTLLLIAVTGCAGVGEQPRRGGGFARPGRTKRELEAAWERWALRNIESGDVVFMRGDNRIYLGLLDFSEFSTGLAGSRYSHVGIAAVEDGEVVVYDIRSTGTMRTRFGALLVDDDVHAVAVKRIRPERKSCTKAAVAFCRRAYHERWRFDDRFRHDNERMYCAELVEQAYRAGGQKLSEPVPIHDLPGFENYPRTVQMIQLVSSIEPDQPVYLPGNERIGIYASIWLEPVAEFADLTAVPGAPASARSASPEGVGESRPFDVRSPSQIAAAQ